MIELLKIHMYVYIYTNAYLSHLCNQTTFQKANLIDSHHILVKRFLTVLRLQS